MIKKIRLIVLMCGIGFMLNACGFASIYEKEPVGIGPDISELKRSPCACMLLKLPTDLPAWMTANG